MTIENRWGTVAVDIKAQNLPALKAKRALKHMPENAEGFQILDFGCGEGKLLLTIHQHYPKNTLFGVDIQEPKHHHSEFHFYDTMTAIKTIPPQSVDFIFAIDTLEHIVDLPQTLLWLRNILKPDGKFIGFIPTEGQPFYFYQLYRKLLGNDIYLKTKDHKQTYTRKSFLRLLENHFKTQEVTYSYHILGTFFDSTFFALTAIPSLYQWWWQKNPYYFPKEKTDSMGVIIKVANILCYWESTLLKSIPFFSSGLHFIARRN